MCLYLHPHLYPYLYLYVNKEAHIYIHKMYIQIFVLSLSLSVSRSISVSLPVAGTSETCNSVDTQPWREVLLKRLLHAGFPERRGLEVSSQTETIFLSGLL